MAHRAGTVDPGILLWLLDQGGLSVAELRQGPTSDGGLRALAGGSGDLRQVVARGANGDPDATLAFDVYVHRLRAGIAAMAATLGGLDILAFTGGIGEHMPLVRTYVTAGLGFLGVSTVDEPTTPKPRPLATRDITGADAQASCGVVATGEDIAIADATRTLVGQAAEID